MIVQTKHALPHDTKRALPHGNGKRITCRLCGGLARYENITCDRCKGKGTELYPLRRRLAFFKEQKAQRRARQQARQEAS